MPLPFINSKSNYFHQPYETITDNWITLTIYLKFLGYSVEEIAIYEKAYFYFIDKPSAFDGATLTVDLYDIFRIDLDALLHDYYYLEYNVSASYKYTQIADKLFFKETLRKNKSSWNAGYRNVMLRLKSYFGFHLISKYILKRVMTEENKKSFMDDIIILSK